MKYKLFDNSAPSESFLAHLDAIGKLEASELSALRDWCASLDNDKVFSFEAFEEANPGLDIDEEHFEAFCDTALYLADRLDALELSIEELRTDLWAVAPSASIQDRLQEFILPLVPEGSRIIREAQRNFHEQSGLPVLFDANFICDLRAVFRAPAFEEEPMRPGFAKILGFAPIVIAELVTSTVDESKAEFYFQMDETALRKLHTALSRSIAQLEECCRVAQRLKETS